MSKHENAFFLKRPQPITAWLQKENIKEKENGLSPTKIAKPTLKVTLKSTDNFISQTRIKEPIKPLSLLEKNEIKRNFRKPTSKQFKQPDKLLSSKRKIQISYRRFEDFEDLPLIIFEGNINYVNEFNDIAYVCDNLLTEVENCKDNIVPVGFDLEWPFNFQTGSGKTALAQICLSEKVCHLLHIYNLKKLPASFIALLSHAKVKIVGINIKNDIWKLTRDFKEFPGEEVVDNNCLDCGLYANSILNRSCRWSLEHLTAYLLRKKISKDPLVRRSQWHIHPLNDAQKLYAATDVYVSLLLYLTVEKKTNFSSIWKTKSIFLSFQNQKFC